jgi:alkanesulfonate monooxygenase SsuD/methylene tetrahydromethanopterin reductase-like flavin-dependent oxidoreductase (luciferase family)
VELGVISLGDITADPETGRRVSAAARIDATLAYARAADELGLDVFTVGEHHSHKFAVASPAVVLAAAAAQTARIRLTSGVTVLSALDPVRVYQDLAQLDLISKGRAEIIAGRNAFAEPFALFGAPMSEYDELFAEKLDLLLRLREQEQITWAGRYRPPLTDAEIAPRALQDPLPVWVGVGGSPGSAARAGHLGLPMMLGYIGGTLAHARRTVEIYRAAGEAAGHDPDTLQVGISTHFYAAASDQRVLRLPAPSRGKSVAAKRASKSPPGFMRQRPSRAGVCRRSSETPARRTQSGSPSRGGGEAAGTALLHAEWGGRRSTPLAPSGSRRHYADVSWLS